VTVIIEHVLQNLTHCIQGIKMCPVVSDVDTSICKGTVVTQLYSNESVAIKSKLQGG